MTDSEFSFATDCSESVTIQNADSTSDYSQLITRVLSFGNDLWILGLGSGLGWLGSHTNERSRTEVLLA